MNWIKVTDELPKRLVDVLFITKDKIMYIGSLCDWDNCDDFHYNSKSHEPNGLEDVTHWAKLPKTPKD